MRIDRLVPRLQRPISALVDQCVLLIAQHAAQLRYALRQTIFDDDTIGPHSVQQLLPQHQLVRSRCEPPFSSPVR